MTHNDGETCVLLHDNGFKVNQKKTSKDATIGNVIAVVYNNRKDHHGSA